VLVLLKPMRGSGSSTPFEGVSITTKGKKMSAGCAGTHLCIEANTGSAAQMRKLAVYRDWWVHLDGDTTRRCSIWIDMHGMSSCPI
jgi:hypothetical protein